MSTPVDSYSKGLLVKFNRYAAWFPNTKLRLGDIGVLDGNLFQYRSNLETMGIRFSSRVSEPVDLDHSSGCSLNMGAGASGGTSVVVSSDIRTTARINFSSSGSFIFQATGCRDHEIADKLKLAKEITQLYRNGRWDPKWAVIQSLYEVERATIIVADSNGKEIEISSDVGFPVGPVPLAKAQGDLTVTSRNGEFTEFVNAQRLTPLFDLLRVKRSWIERIRDIFIDPLNAEDVFEWDPPAKNSGAR